LLTAFSSQLPALLLVFEVAFSFELPCFQLTYFQLIIASSYFRFEPLAIIGF